MVPTPADSGAHYFSPARSSGDYPYIKRSAVGNVLCDPFSAVPYLQNDRLVFRLMLMLVFFIHAAEAVNVAEVFLVRVVAGGTTTQSECAA